MRYRKVLSNQREKRFEFGKNWLRFLEVLDEDRIKIAEESLKNMLEMDNLRGKSFLDIGSGSGLFSLAARRLGARVHSFDYDVESVACTKELKKRYFPEDPNWRIERGSVLDGDYLNRLGTFDIVYSWGVLHHTGDMYKAMEEIVPLVKSEGLLFISIYNDQGSASRRWRYIKKLYNERGKVLKNILLLTVIFYFELRGAIGRLLKMKNPLPFKYWREYKNERGMSRARDYVDWVGGYPFEVAKPEEIFNFFRERGFILERLKTCGGGLGCNEYVFRKHSK